MLIKALYVKNFRKYKKLEVEDIPEKGAITVAGLNESGKTSIGEAICFALYGRTFVLDQRNLYKAVAWGSDFAEVTLKFIDGERDNYTIFRSIDRDGNSQVRLEKKGSDDVVLEEERDVASAILKILGFDFDAFSNSFYLAQRELTTPEPESETIKKMAGIGDYARLHTEFLDTNKSKEKSIIELKPNIAINQSQLDEMNIDETWLPELIDAEQTLGIEQKQRESIVGSLDDNVSTYELTSGQYFNTRKRKAIFSIISYLLLPITLLLWLFWAGVTYFPEKLQSIIGDADETKLPIFNDFSEGWVLPLAVLSLFALLISWFVTSRANSKMLELKDVAKSIAATIEEGHSHIISQAENFLTERIIQTIQQRNSTETLIVIPPREQFANLKQIVNDAPNFEAKPEEVTAAITRLSLAIKKQDGGIEDLGKGLLKDIQKEKNRCDEAGVLRSTVKKLTTVVNKCKREIEVNNIAIGLLQRAAVSSITLFNRNIADISAKALPKFTEGRYSEVIIAEDLSVTVYSDEKKGYMDFDEISAGTQRQIMLSLRMAMSEELSINTGNKEQFIFLDEPFAFFDQKRTRSTLKALPDMSDVLTQIWVVAQEFPNDVEVTKSIVCPLESTELLV